GDVPRKLGFRAGQFLLQPQLVHAIQRLFEPRRNDLHEGPPYCERQRIPEWNFRRSRRKSKITFRSWRLTLTDMSTETSTATQPEPESEGLAANAAQPLVDGVARVLTKPRFRGWIHVYSAGTAVFAGASLVAVSWAVGSTRAGLATLLYTFATIIMFTVS